MARDFAPLLVVGFVGTRRGDADRGPLIRIRPDDAAARLIAEGDLVWIYGPRRHELAPVVLDETLPRGGVVLRDIAGIAISEIVRLVTRDAAQRPVLTSRLT
ncbi:MAG: molybdopterin dinucleotide binding domain-containing protein [Gemmatimonadota bacterium]|jgi:anaerobic selenocysteine-containing dehydrogenase|nr:molybdopterin dinucleotide binding domain-containing protein [Gemmatimonadota bacterium]MDQ8147403.1 molybdopterin dinucleotide binding domain-containing protein [Gemmatimonadota bacterium]MDQ8149173.1 molybdopterin dinucleotide binding domain-containing protein [Gemmatimonadota bacterium]MDQ8155918.1 molybdopterin dinucleotide binding domain-containing protein [Gemmatimonadota bacterium]MDQ8176807.1 molybdopterin dinucleotide binding domain-containing protein [Gemmatimonadota bacterium]